MVGVGAVCVAAAVGSPRSADAGPTGKSPARHVIVVSLDTTRADYFGCYGHPIVRTPRMDSLAAESILFTEYMTVVPTTLASHVSLFTGKYPHSHGTPGNGFSVNDENVMLAEVLRSAGFDTVGFAAAFSLHTRFGFAQGFDHYDERFDRLAKSMGAGHQDERPADAVTDAVISFLDKSAIPNRLFIFVHYFDAHAPYEAPPPFDTMYDPRGRTALPDPATVAAEYRRNPGKNAPLMQRLAAQYAGEISFLDQQLGRLLDYLRRREVLDDAILLVTSDHGENLADHEEFFNHGQTTFRGTMRGVCLVRLPQARLGGTRVHQLVASIDALPTLLDYIGLPIPEGVEGEAIDLLRADAPFPARTRFGQATKPWQNTEADPRWHNMRKARCVRRGDFKFIQVPYAVREELFNLALDPQERNNLLLTATPEVRAQAAELKRKLEAWAESAAPLPSRYNPSQMQETIERLRSLGYLKPQENAGAVPGKGTEAE